MQRALDEYMKGVSQTPGKVWDTITGDSRDTTERDPLGRVPPGASEYALNPTDQQIDQGPYAYYKPPSFADFLNRLDTQGANAGRAGLGVLKNIPGQLDAGVRAAGNAAGDLAKEHIGGLFAGSQDSSQIGYPPIAALTNIIGTILNAGNAPHQQSPIDTIKRAAVAAANSSAPRPTQTYVKPPPVPQTPYQPKPLAARSGNRAV
jgi:hypothetical protein